MAKPEKSVPSLLSNPTQLPPEPRSPEGLKYCVRLGTVKCRWGGKRGIQSCLRSCKLLGSTACPRALNVDEQITIETLTGRTVEELVREGKYQGEVRKWKMRKRASAHTG